MKSFNGLFDRMTKQDEIIAAIYEAAKGKTQRRIVKYALDNIEIISAKVQKMLLEGTWRPPKHKESILQEGAHKKARNIYRPKWNYEQIIHHLLVRQLKPIFVPRFYRYACGVVNALDEDLAKCHYDRENLAEMYRKNAGKWKDKKTGKRGNFGKSKGRGPLFCMRTMRKWIDGYNEKKFYVAELDIHKFYDEINISILKTRLSKIIRDKRFLDVLFLVIEDGLPDTPGKGIPKGFYTSPWLASYYLNPLDMFIAQELRPDHYLRYVDNLYLFGKNKKELHADILSIMEFCEKELDLKINDNWQVYHFEYIPKFKKIRNKRKYNGRKQNRAIYGRPVNCLGYMLFKDRTILRKTILKRARAKAHRMNKNNLCRIIDARTMISYKGWFSNTDTYNYFQKHIKPYVSMRQCRKTISRYNKKHNKKEN